MFADDATDRGTSTLTSTLTTAEQRGPVIARASAYGQPFALLPEHRPWMAVDGDRSTAWLVGEHGNPVGELIELTFTGELPTTLTAHQHTEFPGQRQIAAMTLRAYAGDGRPLGEPRRLDAPFEGIGLGLDPATHRVTLTIDAVAGGVPGTESIVAGVGFSELDFGLAATREIVHVPTDALAEVGADTPLTLVFSRLRSDPADRWRSDAEPTLTRQFVLPDTRSLTVSATVRLDARAADAELAALFGWPAQASTRLLGRPEHAGPAAIDGDPDTAWITGFDASLGASLTIDGVSEPIAELSVLQPEGAFTPITELTLTVASDQRTVRLTPAQDGTARAVVDPPLPPGSLTVTITGTDPQVTIDRRFGDEFELPAAIAELGLAGLPELPDVATPTALTECVTLATIDGTPLSLLLTTGDAGSGPAWLGTGELVSLGCPRPLTVELGPGPHELLPAEHGLPVQLDRIVLGQPWRPLPTAPSVTVDEHTRRARTLTVTGCPDGCWVVLGEGFNDAWHASLAGTDPDDTDLGPPSLLDGGFTGWWVSPELAGNGTFTVHASWSAQRPLTIAYAVTVATVVVCVGVIAAAARRRPAGSTLGPRPGAAPPELTAGDRPGSPPRLAAIAAVWIAAGFLLVGPAGALGGLLGAVGLVVWRGRRIPELTATACVIVLAGAVVVRERRYAPLPDGGWPHAFEHYHGVGMFAIAAVLTAALCADDTNPEPSRATSLPSSP